MSESDLMRAFLAEATERFPKLRLFRRNVVAAQLGDRFVRAGVRGQADIYGFLNRLQGPALPLEIEIKSATGRLTKDQETWRSFCERWGVPYLLLIESPTETASQTVDRWCLLLKQLLMQLPQ